MRKRFHSDPEAVQVGCPVCTIIPPHMLRHLAKHGPEKLRECTLETLQHSERLRGQRDMLAYLGATALATPTGTKRRTIYDLAHGTRLPGQRTRSEGDPRSKDRHVNEADDEGQEHSVTCDEEAASESFLELVQALRQATGK